MSKTNQSLFEKIERECEAKARTLAQKHYGYLGKTEVDKHIPLFFQKEFYKAVFERSKYVSFEGCVTTSAFHEEFSDDEGATLAEIAEDWKEKDKATEQKWNTE